MAATYMMLAWESSTSIKFMFCELMALVDDMMTTGDGDLRSRICAEVKTMNQRCGTWLTLLLFERKILR